MEQQPATGAMRRFLELSPRELEVLMEVRAGLTSKEIAYELGISESTVNKHVAAALRRLGARSRSQAVAMLGDVLDTSRGSDDAVAPHAADPPDFRAATVRALALLLDADNAYYAVWDESVHQLRVVASVGPAVKDGQLFEAGSGAAGIAFQRDRVVSSTDYARLRRAHPDAVQKGAASAVAVPIRAGGHVVGAVAVGSGKALHFTPLHVELLALAARLLGPRMAAATPGRRLAVVDEGSAPAHTSRRAAGG